MRLADLGRFTGEESPEAAFAEAALPELRAVPADRWRRRDPAPFTESGTVAFVLNGEDVPNAVLTMRPDGPADRGCREAVELVLSAYGLRWRARGKARLSGAIKQGLTGPSQETPVRFVRRKDDPLGLAHLFCRIAEDGSKSSATVALRVEALGKATRSAALR